MTKSNSAPVRNFPPERLADLQNLAISIQAQLPNTTVTFDGVNGSFTIMFAYETGDETSIPLKDLIFSLQYDSPYLQLYTFDFFVKNKFGEYVRSGLPNSLVIDKLEFEFSNNQSKAKSKDDTGTKTISWKFPNPKVIDNLSEAYNMAYSTRDKEKLFRGLKFGWSYAFQTTENTFTNSHTKM
jgi:hypothetical protein